MSKRKTENEAQDPKTNASLSGVGSTAGSVEPPTKGRMEQAKQFAMMNFDHWNETTGFVHPHESYYYELKALIEDAVEFGFGVAHGQTWKTICKRIK